MKYSSPVTMHFSFCCCEHVSRSTFIHRGIVRSDVKQNCKYKAFIHPFIRLHFVGSLPCIDFVYLRYRTLLFPVLAKRASSPMFPPFFYFKSVRSVPVSIHRLCSLYNKACVCKQWFNCTFYPVLCIRLTPVFTG